MMLTEFPGQTVRNCVVELGLLTLPKELLRAKTFRPMDFEESGPVHCNQYPRFRRKRSKIQAV